jgi:hypothetical protein
MKRMNIVERFLRHVNKTTSCWLWIGQKNGNGYGVFSGCRPYGRSAHRIAWILFKGNIPKGMCVLHKCDIRNCVNPEHLFIGTNEDNVKDKTKKRRHVHGEKVFGAKLREKQVLDIRTSSLPRQKLAGKYNVHRGTIDSIKTGRSWGWLDNKTVGGTLPTGGEGQLHFDI